MSGTGVLASDGLKRKAFSCPEGAEDLVHVIGGRVMTSLGNEQGGGGAGARGTESAGVGAGASEREAEGGAKTLGRDITSSCISVAAGEGVKRDVG